MILNLTKNATTPEQRIWGVYEPKPQDKEEVRRLLTFEGQPSERLLQVRLFMLAVIADTYYASHVLIEGDSPLTIELMREFPYAITKLPGE